MNIKKLRKRLSNWVAWVGMRVSLWLVRVSPYPVFAVVMRFFAFLWFFGAKRLRKVARETLGIAFGSSKTEKEFDTIIRECFGNISRSMTDLAYYSLHHQKVTQAFVIENQQFLDAALQKGKGVILLTAHFGNFPLMLLELAQLGYKPSVIIRKARDPRIAKRIYDIMANVGVKTIYSIPARESVKQSLQVLRDNEILCVLLDQNFGSGSGVFVEFFGRKAATATGPVVLAGRTDSVLLPVFTIREGEKYRVIFDPPVEMEQRDDQLEMLTVNVSKITRVIETYIRRYPSEWGWMHRRWKSQDAGAAPEGAGE